jgi:hypothetical protein
MSAWQGFPAAEMESETATTTNEAIAPARASVLIVESIFDSPFASFFLV